jgi:uroporphyrinogen III methyltransferase / synthase
LVLQGKAERYSCLDMFSDVNVWLVGAGPGDPSLITVKGLELLRTADVVFYDALAHPALLEECRPNATLVSVGKRYGMHTVEQPEINRMMIEQARLGRTVVRLKGGDPLLFARGAEEAEALVDAGIRYGIVPGVPSPIGISACAGIPLTHRDLSSSVTFVTGTNRHGEPHCIEEWKRLATAADTLCILMGMRRISAITTALIAGGRAPETPTAVVEWGARPEQRVLVATLSTIAERVRVHGFSNPAVIVVGEVVRLREKLRWFDQRGLFGKRIFLARASGQARATMRMISQRGAVPVSVPLISIEDPSDLAAVHAAVRTLPNYDWVLLTSANGAERLLSALSAEKLDARAFGNAKIGVIGPMTAEPLRRIGLQPDLVADDHIAEGLLDGLLQRGKARRVLVFRAAEARQVLPDELRARGVEVDVIAAYSTRRLGEECASQVQQIFSTGKLDAVLVTSSSMAEALVEGLGSQAPERLEDVVVASIGPVTTATLVRLGVRVDVTATNHTIPALLDALEEYLVSHSPDGAG